MSPEGGPRTPLGLLWNDDPKVSPRAGCERGSPRKQRGTGTYERGPNPSDASGMTQRPIRTSRRSPDSIRSWSGTLRPSAGFSGYCWFQALPGQCGAGTPSLPSRWAAWFHRLLSLHRSSWRKCSRQSAAALVLRLPYPGETGVDRALFAWDDGDRASRRAFHGDGPHALCRGDPWWPGGMR